ncbi:hypothetical protein DICVIV_04624 [Dictyocaulus viviparus]|uniref:Uncharacterized protein n=1 Tax=Dictyocaulus viviparus TaxID=29172 RepID=A0A0D8XZS1_DICVI|nr:hypothetical protein DICVIV_04624 [Dictyocaulus viviparus]
MHIDFGTRNTDRRRQLTALNKSLTIYEDIKEELNAYLDIQTNYMNSLLSLMNLIVQLFMLFCICEAVDAILTNENLSIFNANTTMPFTTSTLISFYLYASNSPPKNAQTSMLRLL